MSLASTDERIGHVYHYQPSTCFCICLECSPTHLTRCWRMRASLRMRLELVGVIALHPKLGIGFECVLQRPTIWEARAFFGGVTTVPTVAALRKRSGMVWSSELGERVA